MMANLRWARKKCAQSFSDFAAWAQAAGGDEQQHGFRITRAHAGESG